MKIILNVKYVLLVMLFIWTPLVAAETNADSQVVVIVNSKNSQSLSAQQIKNIYSDITTKWENGNRISVFHLPLSNEAREAFSQTIFGESAQKQVSAELNRKITNTIKNPSKTKRARLVKKLVSRNPDAIGYIPKELLGKSKGIRSVLTIKVP